MLTLYDLTVEQKNSPLGLDEKRPAFSWKLRSDRQSIYQKNYRLALMTGENTVWDSSLVDGGQSAFVVYGGPALKACTEYVWKLEVSDGTETARAESHFETGLLDGRAFDGYAEWITHPLPAEEASSPIFTKIFCVEKEVKRARLYATALGLYEAELNGNKLDVLFGDRLVGRKPCGDLHLVYDGPAVVADQIYGLALFDGEVGVICSL